jgi:Flp pilus assembly protein TadD
MMRGFLPGRILLGALIACAAAVVAPAPAAAQAGYSSYAETPAAALARHVRTLAASPKDFSALIGAGKAALALGDAQAAAGFFARADEANPRSPLPQAGMGAVSVANGEAQGALPYFVRALQLGGSVALIGADRGLAYDLLGRQAQAQSDYRAALGGPDRDEARRRLALSQAIGGDRAGALQTLATLLSRGDAGANRVRAFVLALTGDSQGAMRAIDAAMPGSWARVAPFLQRLPGLTPGQKAAACNLGIFPDSGETAVASANVPTYSRNAATSSDHLASIDDFLQRPPQPSASPAWRPQQLPPQPVQTAYAAPVRKQATASAPAQSRKIWLQLASGPNADALPSQFRRLKSRNRDLFDGISGYVAKSPGHARLVIGPFRGPSDAQIFADDLKSVDIDSFSWTNSESDQIVPLGTE